MNGHDRRTATRAGERGFTLIELLVVIVVLGILAGIALFGVARFRGDAVLAACKADLATVSVAADAYDAQTGTFPANVASLVSGGYLKSAPSGTYTFTGASKSVTRDPACSDGTASSGGTVTTTPTATVTPTATASTAHLGTTGTIVGIGGKCVGVANNRSSDGAAIQLATCSGLTGQQWTMPSSYPGSVRSLGKCLDIYNGGTANRTRTQLLTCNGSAGQLWNLEASGDTLTNPQSGKCFDAENGYSTDGTALIIYDCHNGDNQHWTLP